MAGHLAEGGEQPVGVPDDVRLVASDDAKQVEDALGILFGSERGVALASWGDLDVRTVFGISTT